jgi:putative membrane protein
VSLLQWFVPWEPSVVLVLVLGASAALYGIGCRRVATSTLSSVFFWSGLVSIYAVSQTHFDYFSEREFFVHRIQHTILHHVGPYLIALSRPGRSLVAAMPARLRYVCSTIVSWPPAARLIDALNNPVAAVLLFVGLIYFWLIPSIHFVAMLDWRWYRLMNWSMAINGLMFWNLVLNSYALRPAQLTAATRILMMLAIVPPQIFIGALISFAGREVFLSYGICGRAIAGIGPIADQQIGGLILWIPAAMMSVLGVITVINREWLTRR